MQLTIPRTCETYNAKGLALTAILATNKHFQDNPLSFNNADEKSRTRLTFTLRVADSSKPPARKSSSGRRLVAANWEAHRLFMVEVFKACPDATIRSKLATYKGKADFEAKFAATYDANVGAAYQPIAYGSL